MGAEVTLVEALAQVLPLEDEDIGREVNRAMKRRGIDVHTATKVEDAQLGEDQVTATLVSDRGDRKDVTVELILVATGRAPVTADLGYEDVGVRLDRGFVVPADWDTLETSVKGRFAGGGLLPPTSRTRPPGSGWPAASSSRRTGTRWRPASRACSRWATSCRRRRWRW